MKKLPFFLPTLVSLFLLAGCGAVPEPPAETPSPLPTITIVTVSPPPSEAPAETPLPATEVLPEVSDSDFVSVTQYVPAIAVELRYATDDNFTGKSIYAFRDAYLRYGTVKKLAAVNAALAEQGLSLKIWDAFRPVSAQFRLWEVCPDASYVANPYGGYSAHSRGNTVDVTLVDAQGRELAMPTGFDDFSALADRDYGDCDPTAAENARLLERTMLEHGFSAYHAEWWHFTDETVYPPEECFDPALISPWVADCEEYINLREKPDADAASLARIPAGGVFTLLGRCGDFALAEYEGRRGYVAAGYIRPLDELPELWTPDCEEYISLRTEPDGETVIARIPLGATLRLEAWSGRYALVSYGDESGYVLADRIKPADGDNLRERLRVVAPGCRYTYEQMTEDAEALAALYPEQVTVSSIGTSVQGRELTVLRLGSPDARHHVLIQATIHGREHLTAWLAMALADYSLSRHYLDPDAVCFHIIPMSDPDGVTVSQTGVLNDEQLAIYRSDKAMGFTAEDVRAYAETWKANAVGVDLNRNFPTGRESCTKRLSPSSELYYGAEAFSEPETRALRDYTLAWDFDATVSLHSSGCVIYHSYGDDGETNHLSASLAECLERITGCTPTADDGTGGAGYKDWCVDALAIPAVTVELGCEPCPLGERAIGDLFFRCRTLLPTLAAWVLR